MNIAIYSRKSKLSDKGESIENQIHLCKEYALSHFSKNEDELKFIIYEDEGFSGGNIHRPKFQQLIEDIDSRTFDTLICYRLDRISRNVLDFSTTLEKLQRNNINFISIKEQFDTTSPMGRAMIYVSSVFAQLERETIAERIRDNMLELAKTGRWLGGSAPLGYKIKSISYGDTNKKMSILEVNKEELELVKMIYDKYIEFKSLSGLETFMLQHKYTTRKGSIFTMANIKTILKNPVYVKANKDVATYLENSGISVFGEMDNLHGLLTYNKTKAILTQEGRTTKVARNKDEWLATVSSHEGIIDADVWLYVQNLLSKNSARNFNPNMGKTHNALLTGLLRCPECNSPMGINHGHMNKEGNRFYYYCCTLKKRSKSTLCKCKNIKADEIDVAILNYLENTAEKNLALLENMTLNDLSSHTAKQASNKINLLTKQLETKKIQVDNLIMKIANLDEDLSILFLNKIRTLKDEITSIEAEISSLQNEQVKLSHMELEIDLLKIYLNKCRALNSLSKEECHQIIHELIQSVSFNPKTHELNIEFNAPVLAKKKVTS